MPKKKTPAEKTKDQFKRFVETAREHGVDEKEVENSFRTISQSNESKHPKKST